MAAETTDGPPAKNCAERIRAGSIVEASAAEYTLASPGVGVAIIDTAGGRCGVAARRIVDGRLFTRSGYTTKGFDELDHRGIARVCRWSDSIYRYKARRG
jgi:hypothetical protein